MSRFIHVLPFLLIAFLLAYVIWSRGVRLDIPVALRIGLSVIPGLVGYRAFNSFYTFVMLGRKSPRLVEFLILVMGIVGAVLYHIWRDVKLDDFK
jgi:hypothetical protein